MSGFHLQAIGASSLPAKLEAFPWGEEDFLFSFTIFPFFLVYFCPSLCPLEPQSTKSFFGLIKSETREAGGGRTEAILHPKLVFLGELPVECLCGVILFELLEITCSGFIFPC